MTPNDTLDAAALEDRKAAIAKQTAQQLRDWSVRVRHGWSRDLLQSAAAHIDGQAKERDALVQQLRAAQADAARWRAIAPCVDRLHTLPHHDYAGFRLRDALLGFRLDSLFYRNWKADQDALDNLLDAIDAARRPNTTDAPGFHDNNGKTAGAYAEGVYSADAARTEDRADA